MKFKLLLLLLQCRTTGRFPPSSTYLWQVWSCLSVTWFLTSVMMLFITRMLYILVTLETRWKRLLRWVRNESVSALIRGKNKILFFKHMYLSGSEDLDVWTCCSVSRVPGDQCNHQRSGDSSQRQETININQQRDGHHCLLHWSHHQHSSWEYQHRGNLQDLENKSLW